MIYVFLLEIIVFIFFLIIFSKCDLLAPALCVCYVFFISTICVIYNQHYWNYSLSVNAFVFLSIGLIIFCVASSFTLWIMRGKKQNICKETGGLTYISICKWKIIFVSIYDIVFSAIYLKKVIGIAGKYTSAANWYSMMKKYREISSYGILRGNDAMPVYAVYTFRLVEVFGYVFVYVFINNFFYKKKKARAQFSLLVPVLIYAVSGILTSGRLYFLQFASAVVFLVYIIWHRKYGWNRFIGVSFLIKVVSFFLMILLLFVLTRGLVGRGIEYDSIYYITLYGGQSIPCLDLFLSDMPDSSDVWGKETFMAIINFVGKVTGNADLRYIAHKEFRYINGMVLGNVYTAFRRYYYDFGYAGVIILTSLAAMFYTFFYVKSKYIKGRTKIDYRLIVFSYFSYGIFLYSIDDRLFGQLISVGTLIWILMLYGAGLFLNLKIKSKENR